MTQSCQILRPEAKLAKLSWHCFSLYLLWHKNFACRHDRPLHKSKMATLSNLHNARGQNKRGLFVRWILLFLSRSTWLWRKRKRFFLFRGTENYCGSPKYVACYPTRHILSLVGTHLTDSVIGRVIHTTANHLGGKSKVTVQNRLVSLVSTLGYNSNKFTMCTQPDSMLGTSQCLLQLYILHNNSK